jgi:hypothetical protein
MVFLIENLNLTPIIHPNYSPKPTVRRRQKIGAMNARIRPHP